MLTRPKITIQVIMTRISIEKCLSKIMEREGRVNSDTLKDVFLVMESGELTFFKFFDRFVLDLKKIDSGLRVERLNWSVEPFMN